MSKTNIIPMHQNLMDKNPMDENLMDKNPTHENLMDKNRKELILVVQKFCLVRGDFTLASGKKSNHYFNMKALMMNPSALQLAARALRAQIHDDYSYIGGLEMGAVPLTAAVLALDEAQTLKGFFVRKAAKEHGLKKLVEGLVEGENLKGKSVVMLDDVTSTGGSALKAAKALQEQGALVQAVVTLLDREEGADKNFADAGINFTACLTKTDIL